MNFYHNDEGVSPIIATLVLIVVAIIGAAAVGMIMGSFSSNVSNQASSSDTAGQATTTINVGSGIIIDPLAQTLADAYTENHTGVKVTVTKVGSPPTMIGTGIGVYQIGMCNMPTWRSDYSTITNKYPNLKFTTIGMGSVVFIGGTGTTVTTVDCTLLGNAFHTGASADISAAIPGADTLVTMNNTEVGSAVDQWLATGTGSYQTGDNKKSCGNVISYNSNAEVLDAIQQNPHYFGFVNYGFAASAGNTVKDFYTIHDSTGTYTANSITTHQVEKDCYNGLSSSTSYPISLTTPMQCVMNGPPSVVEQSFIDYALSPDNEWAFKGANMDSINDIFL